MNKKIILPFLENRFYLSGRILLAYLLKEFAIDTFVSLYSFTFFRSWYEIL